jgi:uncharacterized membrane protein
MTDNNSENHNEPETFMSAYNVISVSFDPDSNAYAGMTALNELKSQTQLDLDVAAIVARADDGAIVVKDRVESPDFAGAVSGGLLALVIGILGGPLGVLFGGTYGLMVGSLVDLHELEETDSVLTQISASVRPGHTALLAQVTEQSPEVVDSAMARLGGTVLRRPVEDVEAEVAAADKAQRHAKREAARELRRARRERDKEHAQATIEQLKAKLGHQDKTAAGS